MGMLIDGAWHDKWYDTAGNGGAFQRQESAFRDWVTRDGSPGPSGKGGFEAEAGRYHLYVSLACPWAHRTLIFRKLKRLEGVIGLSVVDWFMGESGWRFSDDVPGATPDHVNGKRLLHEVYTLADPGYTGRVTVPVLWDKERQTIVSNESAEIIRMLNRAFDSLGDPSLDFHPAAARSEIEAWNRLVYDTVNNGVYKAGFATAQDKYEAAVTALFETLDALEAHLAAHRYLAGDRLTEADWRLFTTLVRFDPVYHGHFKCNLRRLADYPHLWAYARELYQVPGVAETVDMTHIKSHYYVSHKTVNPTGIVPAGPIVDFSAPHGRDALPVAA